MEKQSTIENKRVSAIKTLLEREGITQEQLAGKIRISPRKGSDPTTTMEPQNLSRCLTSGKVSEKLCYKIHDAFPKYRIEWLLGYSDAMTNADLLIDEIQKANEEAYLLHNGFSSFAKLSGFQIDFAPIVGNPSIEENFRNMHEYCTITRDGKSVTLSMSELNDFENELCDYIQLRLFHMMK